MYTNKKYSTQNEVLKMKGVCLPAIANRLISIVLPLVFLMLAGCAREVRLTDYINIKKPLHLTITKSGNFDTKREETIEPNSQKYNQLIHWGENNLRGWHSTPASFFVIVAVRQDKLRLLYYQEGSVVVILSDEKGNEKQFQKSKRAGELDFLLN